MSQERQISQEDIRNARHTGFHTALAHLPDDSRKNLYERYTPQDERRERNITNFHAQVLGDK